ncbi:YidB family protein [Streptomyces sp. MZ04]|uniref:YidB family protein n=1 Tax=Streptomyces sp. MZ04 TaxID=2559236 RepID=UPI00107EBB1E|nr:YidB family protein [Streptomyces sp. MZ04]TGA91890.1 hypothetical protein E2651_37500 [Streptomyces sp. MZ04]
MASLSEAAQSWISTGTNEPISGEELLAQTGTEPLAALADKAGSSTETVADQLAEALPTFVDTVTPEGTLTDDPALIAQATETFERTTPFTVRSVAPSSTTTAGIVVIGLSQNVVGSLNVDLLGNFEIDLGVTGPLLG